MISYAGNGSYCYANSLHMCLQAANAGYLPAPNVLECLTLMPFGAHYTERDSQPAFFPDLFPLDPEQGLDMAMHNLGWECDKWSARRDDRADHALDRLRATLDTGVALLGPLDMGFLTYSPRARGVASGADHYVVCLALEAKDVLLHDPQGYPFATLPVVEFLKSWRADEIGYALGAFTIRSAFRQVETLVPDAVRTRALASLRHVLAIPATSPQHFGGAAALRRVAQLMRSAEPPASLRGLHHFALPLGARRSQDAASFLNEAGLPEAAAAMARKAELYGRAQYGSVKANWARVAESFDALAGEEERFTAAMLT